METKTLKVEGMSCGHCKMSIEKALTALNGILSAEVNLSEKNVTISYNSSLIELINIKEVIEDQGFDVYL